MSAREAISGLCLVLACLIAAPALAAGPPPAVQSSAAQSLVRGVELGRPNMVTVKNKASAEAIGLTGVNAGDTLEVTKQAEDRWLVRDPKTNRSVTVDKDPRLAD